MLSFFFFFLSFYCVLVLSFCVCYRPSLLELCEKVAICFFIRVAAGLPGGTLAKAPTPPTVLESLVGERLSMCVGACPWSAPHDVLYVGCLACVYLVALCLVSFSLAGV